MSWLGLRYTHTLVVLIIIFLFSCCDALQLVGIGVFPDLFSGRGAEQKNKFPEIGLSARFSLFFLFSFKDS